MRAITWVKKKKKTKKKKRKISTLTDQIHMGNMTMPLNPIYS